MKKLLLEKASESVYGDSMAFLQIKSFFGDLAAEEQFSDRFLFFLHKIRKDGVAKVIAAIDEF